LTDLSRILLKTQKQISNIISTVYFSTINLIENQWYSTLEYISSYISYFDVIIDKSHIARQYKYCKPIISISQDKSFVNCDGLRHALIEHIQTNELYVPNDIVLGQENNNQDGILLFAVNSSGKTSLIRSPKYHFSTVRLLLSS
jgi:DNA mismatch repair protein MutS